MVGKRGSRSLVFHIGQHKTGTTTIQHALANGRIKLRDARILYPARMSHNYLKNHVSRYAEDGSIVEGRPGMPGLQEIALALEKDDYDFAVLSGEEFADSNPTDVRRVMTAFLLPHVADHRVLCYLRPHAARVLSSFVEQTKIGLHAGSLAQFHDRSLKSSRFLYSAKLAPWVATFGGHFVVRPMVRQELAQGSVLHDFARAAFGDGVDAQIETDTDANESLCLEDLMLLKLVQSVLAERSKNTRLELGWALAAKLAEAPSGARKKTKVWLHRALAERIRRDYRADARQTDDRFFGGRPVLQTELDRAVEESVVEPMPVEPSDYFSAAEMLNIVTLTKMMDDMLDRRPKEWPKFFLDRRAERFQQ